ncbi:MAG: hypothetical protein JSW08_00360 [archaeon]|nr:MAG: hypothetical protein JSW08_00360 [archaeon]
MGLEEDVDLNGFPLERDVELEIQREEQGQPVYCEVCEQVVEILGEDTTEQGDPITQGMSTWTYRCPNPECSEYNLKLRWGPDNFDDLPF